MIENFEIVITEGNCFPGISEPTVGVKFVYKGEMYGTFVHVPLSEPFTPKTVVEIANTLVNQLLGGLNGKEE